jgi:hypothetical protein
MILGDGTEVRMGNTYGQGEVGDERGSKEMDRCPLTQTLEYTKDKYNVKIRNERVSPKVPPTTYVGQRVKGRRSKGVEWIITK